MAAATLGWTNVPGPPFEASIAFAVAEIIHSRNGRPGLTERYPWIVAFTLGLLHGFGFASALAKVEWAHAVLSGSNMHRANVSGANFGGVEMATVNMEYANVSEAKNVDTPTYKEHVR